MYKYLIIASLLLGACNTAQKESADSIVFNAQIITMDDALPSAEVMVIRNGKILAIGGKDLLDRYTCPDSAMQDAGKQYVYPGLIDAHCHFYGYAKTLLTCDLVGTKSWDEVLQRLKTFAAENPQTPWIQGRGWDQNDWAEKAFPLNEALNKLFPDKPVMLKRIDGHAAICNQKALDMAGISIKTVVSGGMVVQSNGQATGVLIDNAVDLVAGIMEAPKAETLIPVLQKAEAECYSHGLTTLADAGLDLGDCLFLDSLSRKKLLSIYLYLMLNPDSAGLAYAQKNGILENEHTRISSFKLYADGALGSRGARLKKDYCDHKMHAGMFMKSLGFYSDFCKTVYTKTQYQVNTHCIGDSANRLMLETYGLYLKAGDDRRWRIEHAQVVDTADMHLFKRYSVIPSVQPTHASSDAPWVEDRLCRARMAGAYAYKTLLKQNGYLPLGTDFPVEYINPLYTFYSAVFRKNANAPEQAAFMPEERLTCTEALKGMTIWAAKACKLEHRKGSLQVGKDADYVVMNQNLLMAQENTVLKTKVIRVCRMGKTVYRNTQ